MQFADVACALKTQTAIELSVWLEADCVVPVVKVEVAAVIAVGVRVCGKVLFDGQRNGAVQCLQVDFALCYNFSAKIYRAGSICRSYREVCFMNTTLRRDADAIVRSSIQAVLPDEAVRRALEDFQPKGGRVLLVAAG